MKPKFCPGCQRPNNLYSMFITIGEAGRRKDKRTKVFFCYDCKLMISNDNNVKFWNGKCAEGILQ